MRGREGSGAPVSRWPDRPLLGRDDLIAELIAAADDAVHGTGSVVLLTGEAGIGKTSVARQLTTQVRGDLAVTWGTCSADRSAPPFWPWRDLLRSEPSSRPVGHGPADRAIGAERFERLTELRDELIGRARHGPVLHVVEDLQWADVASVLLLVHVAAAIVDAPLLVVATLRTGEPMAPPLDDAIEEVRRAARVLPLLALDDLGVAALIRAAGIEPNESLTALVRARTGGNPLLVTELLRSVPSTMPADDRLAALSRDVPSRVASLVAHRLARLPALVADVLVTAAVIGREGEARTLAAARGASVAAVVDLLEQARAAHFLDAAPPGRWQFRHDLIRDAVYSTVTGTGRAQRHAQVVEALAADGTTLPPVLAHHALAALPMLDAGTAVALATSAGESAFAQHAYEDAVSWFSRALAAAPAATSSRWRADLLVQCGEARRHIGEVDPARQAFLDAAALTADPGLLARAALGYADPGADLGIAYRTDDPVTGALLDRAIAAQPTGDSVTAVLLEARLAAELYFSDEPDRARRMARSAVDRAGRLDDPLALGAANAVMHDAYGVGQREVDERLRQSAQLLEWARATGSSAALLTAHRARVFDWLAAGDVAQMDAEVVAFRRLAEPLRAPGYLWWPALWSAMRALLEGRHDEAEARAVAAYEIGASTFPSLSFLNLSFLLFFLRREQGRLDEMEHATRAAAASHADIPALRVGLTFLLAELGRVDDVQTMLAGFDEPALDRLHDRNWPAAWFQLARAAFVVGDRALAARLLEDRHRPLDRCVMVSLATVCLGATDLATAWLRHTIGDLDGADEGYAAAEAMNARIGARTWLAQARADRARLVLDRGRSVERQVPAEIPAPATFRRTGAVWDLEFAGRTVRLPHARGLSDVAVLLARPGEALAARQLVEEPGTPAAARGAPALDERARREIRERLHELDAEIAEAEAHGDGERAALARERLQALAEAVARDTGLGGRSRRIGDPVERARKTVSTRIRRAIAQVVRVHPELGRHLERSIDTGAWCAYRPAEPVTWNL